MKLSTRPIKQRIGLVDFTYKTNKKWIKSSPIKNGFISYYWRDKIRFAGEGLRGRSRNLATQRSRREAHGYIKNTIVLSSRCVNNFVQVLKVCVSVNISHKQNNLNTYAHALKLQGECTYKVRKSTFPDWNRRWFTRNSVLAHTTSC